MPHEYPMNACDLKLVSKCLVMTVLPVRWWAAELEFTYAIMTCLVTPVLPVRLSVVVVKYGQVLGDDTTPSQSV